MLERKKKSISSEKRCYRSTSTRKLGVIWKPAALKLSEISQEGSRRSVCRSEPVLLSLQAGEKTFTLVFFLRFDVWDSIKDRNFQKHFLLCDSVCV